MLLNFYYAKKSTIEASEKFAEALVKVLNRPDLQFLIKSAGKYSCTIFVPGALPNDGVVNIIQQMLRGKYNSVYGGPDSASFISVDHSTDAVESLAKSYHDRGKSLF